MVENFKECVMYDKGYGAGYKYVYLWFVCEIALFGWFW